MIHGIPALQSGYQAIRSGLTRLDAAAAAVVRASLPAPEGAPPPEDDLVGSLVEMMLARRDVEIGGAVVGRAAEAQRSLLDILA